MKKFAVPIFVIFFAVHMNGCAPNDSIQSNIKTLDMWQESYVAFLKEFPFISEDDHSPIDKDDIYYLFSLRDLDNNSIPELLIFQMSNAGIKEVLTVYTYDGGIYKLGDYSNPKGSFISWFCVSKNSMFPGLYETWNGGGLEYYQYLSIEDGELICEYLWVHDLTGESPVINVLSNNQELVDSSMDLFPKTFGETENVLEAYFINEETIEQVILNYSNEKMDD